MSSLLSTFYVTSVTSKNGGEYGKQPISWSLKQHQWGIKVDCLNKKNAKDFNKGLNEIFRCENIYPNNMKVHNLKI